jgi:hypothetical protein
MKTKSNFGLMAVSILLILLQSCSSDDKDISGKWATRVGADSLEIVESYLGYEVIFKTKMDEFAPHSVSCTGANRKLTGDFLSGKNNFNCSLSDDGHLLLTIDPFVEFHPVHDLSFSRVK